MISRLDWLPSAEARGCSRDANTLASSRSSGKLQLLVGKSAFFFSFGCYDSHLLVLLLGVGDSFKGSPTPLIQGHDVAFRQGFWVNFYFLD